jgi:hypothetical protein
VTKWIRFIAPSPGDAVRRALLVLGAAVVILAGTVALKGLPTHEHEIYQNEKLRFAAHFNRGMINLFKEVVSIAVIACIGRRVFQIRL